MAKKIVEIEGIEVEVHQQQMLDFQHSIEKLAHTDGITYLEAIQEYCEQHYIEIETVQNLISHNLKDKIRREAVDLNLIDSDNVELPF